MKKSFLSLILILLCQQAFSQIGGESVFRFTTLPHTARVTALGGNVITVKDSDVALAYHNPATLNATMNNQLSFNHSFYLADISHGYFGYGRHFDKIKTTFHTGIQYVSYGDFQGTDPTGQLTGSFSASEYAFTVGAGRQYNERLSFGANAKLLTSQFESYKSLGIASDLGVFYSDTANRITATLLFRNIGTQIITYQPDNFESLPFDMQIGISKRLRHLPFRFSVIVHNLHRWNIRYNDPNIDEPAFVFGGEDAVPDEKSYFVDNLFRHFIFNGEFLLGKNENFRMRIGYNHLRRSELSVSNTVGFAGFSFGVGLKVNRFKIDYGRGLYHLAGGVNHITISTDLSEFKR
jgi:hypothetical protein